MEKLQQTQGRVQEAKVKLAVFYDDATNYIGMLMEVIPEKQADLLKYVQETYSNVRLFTLGGWLRLDFGDGSVRMDDLR